MRRICKFLLKLLGWKAMDGRVEEDKAIILGVPHTSAWDFLISYLFYTSVGGKAYIMIKKEFFIGPLSPLLKALGGIPVDRKKGATITLQMIHAMNNAKVMHLAIAPEGTRKATTRWKSGFHTIAKACNVPVYLGYFDWKRKEVGRGVKFTLTDNVQEDLKRIRQHYAAMEMEGKHKGMYTTGYEVPQ